MADDEDSPLTRRRALLGLATIGGAAVLGGVSTISFYNDQESINATFNAGFPGDGDGDDDGDGDGNGGSAGQINLVVNWVTVHNDEIVDQTTQDNNVEADEESNTLSVQNAPMFPDHEGAIFIALHLEGSNGQIGYQLQSGNYQDNGHNAAEEAAEDPVDDEGELQEAVEVTVGEIAGEPDDPTDLPPQFTNQHFDGLVEDLEEGLDMFDLVTLQEGEIVWLAYYWSFTNDPGNEHQTDSYDIEFTFNAETV